MKQKLLLMMLFFGMLVSQAQVTSVAIVGEAAGGWPGAPGNPGPEDVNQMTTTDGENWTLNGLTLNTSVSGGGIKFRANNAWDLNWGTDSFPNGIGTQGGANIICYAGTYDVTFSSTTGAYSFVGGTAPPIVKLIGAAVDNPLGLTMSTNNGTLYTLTNISLITGNAQFEIDGVIVGEDTFPTGTLTGVANNIPVIGASYASVSVNIITGEYSFIFTPINPNSDITISGTAIGGSGNNVTMITNDGVSYVYNNLSTTQGELLFNITSVSESYGNQNFPSGTATLNGDAILVPSGTWTVTFNAISKAYSFNGNPENPSISIVGSAVGGWPTGAPGEIDSQQMNTTDGITYSITNLVCTVGSAKFRQNNEWTLNWGSVDFPTGTGTQGGNDIVIVLAGTYDVIFNRITGDYNFMNSTPFPFTKLIGTATGSSEGLEMTSISENVFQIENVNLVDGTAQFYVDGTIFGETQFPTGILTGATNFFAIPAGFYNSVSLNLVTGEYSFALAPTIAIVGTGAGGWPTGGPGEIDANRLETTDGINFRLNNITLTDGEVKFRQNNSWDVFWGGTSLTGTLILNGPSIPTVAGTYTISMNRDTGDYSLSSGTFTKSFFTVYPNPTQNILNVVSDLNTAIVSIEIFDTLGKNVMAIQPNTSSIKIDVSGITSGLYFAKITTASGFETIKLMKN